MQEFEGTIEFAGNSYRVAGVIEERERNGSKKWSGYFVTPEGAEFDPKADGPHKLKLDDNRSGNVIFASMDVDSSGTSVIDFTGTGPLQ